MANVPQMVRFGEVDRGRRSSVYITITELYNWASGATSVTQEGQPYHDALDIFHEGMAAIAAFFDGSKGTYIDIMTQEQREYPVICDMQDIQDTILDQYNTRLVYIPAFNQAYPYQQNDDYINARYYYILKKWVSRIKRFCKFNNIRYTKLIQTMMIEYNPVADFWENEKRIGANAPYVSISNNKPGQAGPAENMTIDDWNQDVNGKGYTVTTNNSAGTNGVMTEHYTTTYDDASRERLESYDKQVGGTSTDTTTTSPNSGYFEKREVTGNHGNIDPQDMILKEYDIAKLWNIVELFLSDLSQEIFLQLWWTP